MKLGLPEKTIYIVGGDRVSLSIACASILAKVTRDRIMEGYGRTYPRYGFGRHKGYGTKEHKRAIDRFGPSPIHRMSFRPMRDDTNRRQSIAKRRLHESVQGFR